MPVQVRNSEMVELLAADFQLRYEPQFAWKSAVSAFAALPALRAFWPMSSVDYTNPQATDVSGNGYDLTNNNSADFGHDQLVPYVNFDGTNQYLSRADGGAGNWADILGNEAYVITAQRGVTFGGWFMVDTTDANAQFLIAKGNNAAANTTYLITCPAGTTTPQFAVSDGVAFNAVNAGAAMGTTTWAFVAARYTAATPECDIWVNDTVVNDAAGVPAAPLADHAMAFTIGASPTPGLYLDGRASLCFLCACAVPDAAIFSLFHQTRCMFNV